MLFRRYKHDKGTLSYSTSFFHIFDDFVIVVYVHHSCNSCNYIGHFSKVRSSFQFIYFFSWMSRLSSNFFFLNMKISNNFTHLSTLISFSLPFQKHNNMFVEQYIFVNYVLPNSKFWLCPCLYHLSYIPTSLVEYAWKSQLLHLVPHATVPPRTIARDRLWSNHLGERIGRFFLGSNSSFLNVTYNSSFIVLFKCACFSFSLIMAIFLRITLMGRKKDVKKASSPNFGHCKILPQTFSDFESNNKQVNTSYFLGFFSILHI